MRNLNIKGTLHYNFPDYKEKENFCESIESWTAKSRAKIWGMVLFETDNPKGLAEHEEVLNGPGRFEK
jgi:hypothetical protein